MDFKEMLRTVSQSAGRAWERVRYLTRANRILAISLFLVLSVGLIVWARSGFSFQISRFFAANQITPSVVLRYVVRDDADEDGVEYNLIWATNLDEDFPTATGIDVQCVPTTSEPEEAQFFGDIKAALKNGSYLDNFPPGSGWATITPKGGIVRVELAAAQAPVSFKVQCTASKKDYNGGTLTTTSWSSNEITIPGLATLQNLTPSATLKFGIRDEVDSNGTIEYNLEWTTNLPENFPSLTDIDVQCLPVAAPGDTKNAQFFADIAGKMKNGEVSDGLPLSGWYTITPKFGLIRIELGAFQTPTSFRVDCRASKAAYNGGRLSGTSWFSNTICLPSLSGGSTACVARPGGVGAVAAVPGDSGAGTGGSSGGSGSRSAPTAGTPATCQQLKGTCRVNAEGGEVSVAGTGCAAPERCFATKSTGWSYCDYATNACKLAPETLVSEAQTAVGSQDFSAPQCGATNCIPGNCRKWEGADAGLWKPTSQPSGVPACEPLSVINSTTFPGYKGREIVKPPITFPDANFYTGGPELPNCFVIEDRSSSNPSFGGMAGMTVPQVQAGAPGGKLFMKAFVINNCPWEVHYILQVDVDPKSKSDNGAGARACGDTPGSGLVALNMPDGFDFPSCWNNALPATPANCAREISIEFNLNTYTCGSAGITTGIWHRVKNGAAGGENAAAERGGALQYSTHLDWGKDCVGAVTERRPACGVVNAATAPVVTTPTRTPTPFPTPTPTPLPTPLPTSNPTVVINPPTTGNQLQCGPLAQTVTMNQSAYVQAFGGTGVYAFTTSSDGVLTRVAQNRTAIQYPTPGGRLVTVTDGQASVQCTVNVSEPGIPGNNDEDVDGITDNVECPSFPCKDTDRDGIPDYLDSDSRTVLGGGTNPGQVQTGPGDATLLALIVSGLVSLLYVTYTHSPLSRRREAEKVSGDQGPMDFRS